MDDTGRELVEKTERSFPEFLSDLIERVSAVEKSNFWMQVLAETKDIPAERLMTLKTGKAQPNLEEVIDLIEFFGESLELSCNEKLEFFYSSASLLLADGEISEIDPDELRKLADNEAAMALELARFENQGRQSFGHLIFEDF